MYIRNDKMENASNPQATPIYAGNLYTLNTQSNKVVRLATTTKM